MNTYPDPQKLLAEIPRRLEALLEEIAHMENLVERERKALEAMVPVPVHWRRVKCGKDRCKRCPHGPYPYLRVKKDGKWRWKYLGKGWQPPEGFAKPEAFKNRLIRYKQLVKRLEELKEKLAALERLL